MSLITRCPACQTLFRVVLDQLRISEGWVRCGQCAEIFDASQHLLPQTPDATAQDINIQPDPAPTDDSNGSQLEAAALPPPVQMAQGEKPQNLEPEHSAELNDVTFLRSQRGSSYWRKPLTRLLLGFFSFALLLGLIGQIVFYERDRLAALQPSLKPWLQAFCAPLNCSLSALRQKDSITIDSSSFTRNTGDSYGLNFTLKNASTIALAVPAIELTLTNSLDQPVVRRVFLPAELNLKFDTLAAGAEWSASLVVASNLTGTTQQIVGYRLYVFYP
jgi:predicted Zn finger-like uncharacterized protein